MRKLKALRQLCDVNVLLALCYEEHRAHLATKEWLERCRASSALTCRTTQLSLLRLLTTQAVMLADVCTREQAWSIWDNLMADFRFHFVDEPLGVDSVLRRLSTDKAVSPKLWQDDYLAAFALTAGSGLVSFDQGFSRYSGLQLELLT